MKTLVSITLLAATLTACATPVTTLKNAKTGKTVTCGGSMQAAAAGGLIGYNMQQNKDADCVQNYQKSGYKVAN